MWLERRAVPEIKRIGRLHVVVAIEQDMRAAVIRGASVLREHHGVARSFANRSVEPETSKLVTQPFGSAAPVLRVVGLRADGK